MWTPYKSLIHYAYFCERHRLRKGVSAAEVQDIAEKSAEKMLGRSFPEDLLVPAMAWPKDSASLQFRSEMGFSGNLVNFLFRTEHRGRKAMEQLLLAYFVAGHTLSESVTNAFADYEQLGAWAPKLNLRDAVNFAQFFWDWRSQKVNVAGQIEYAETYLSQADLDIYTGRTTIEDVQIIHNIIPPIDISRTMQKATAIMGHVVQREMQRLYREGNIIKNPIPFGSMAGFAGSFGAMAKNSSELSGSSNALESLQSFIDDEWTRVDPDVIDYAKQERDGASFETLLNENARVSAEKPDPSPDE